MFALEVQADTEAGDSQPALQDYVMVTWDSLVGTFHKLNRTKTSTGGPWREGIALGEEREAHTGDAFRRQVLCKQAELKAANPHGPETSHSATPVRSQTILGEAKLDKKEDFLGGRGRNE